MPPVSAAVSGTLVPSGTETEIVAGAETLIITLTNDTWDPTIGADNAEPAANARGYQAGWWVGVARRIGGSGSTSRRSCRHDHDGERGASLDRFQKPRACF